LLLENGADAAEPHSRTFALIAIKDMPRQIKLICARLEQLFGFTPAERRLGALLLDGYTLQDAARFTNKSLPTARTQLRSMQKKTGSRSQAELVKVFLSPPSIL
jgi:DNA-binding CsgD family transcriptional regulator